VRRKSNDGGGLIKDEEGGVLWIWVSGWDGIIKVGHVLGFCIQKRFGFWILDFWYSGIIFWVGWLVGLVFVVLFEGCGGSEMECFAS